MEKNDDVKEGDRIRVPVYTMGKRDGTRDFTVEKFRHCLGIFWNKNYRKAGDFTPLCDLYIEGPNSEVDYIPNFGEYFTNMVPAWERIDNDA